jgi:hypothetical protein
MIRMSPPLITVKAGFVLRHSIGFAMRQSEFVEMTAALNRVEFALQALRKNRTCIAVGHREKRRHQQRLVSLRRGFRGRDSHCCLWLVDVWQGIMSAPVRSSEL